MDGGKLGKVLWTIVRRRRGSRLSLNRMRLEAPLAFLSAGKVKKVATTADPVACKTVDQVFTDFKIAPYPFEIV